MSTPMSSGGGMDDDQSSSKKPVSFQFCAECSNMLYPREDNSSRTLQFVCRTCHYTTEAINTCVFRNELSSTASLHAGIIPGMGKDPTVGTASDAPTSESAEGSVVLSVVIPVADPSLPVINSLLPSPSDSEHSSDCETTIALCTLCGIPVSCSVCGDAYLYVPIESCPATQPITQPAITQSAVTQSAVTQPSLAAQSSPAATRSASTRMFNSKDLTPPHTPPTSPGGTLVNLRNSNFFDLFNSHFIDLYDDYANYEDYSNYDYVVDDAEDDDGAAMD
ncbi:hypothetical protein GGTG_12744 [Gaeumannomyces tritici R3-111a-1]|uniref:DNA-directed RNA polymerase II subunit RPB9-like zinc ribbon domain-containing protein n=1 Tax=Gaeumannomyces tritici (strain R3-111a-1) TaxID=644352 RepID=J3PGW4_GAET3|nr:hypothetical protein GGTG_12744 [Gaeumannomyces tritici R3-111a-1]EJT69861.1 hypothetical protein GGTG_12744 [Gaeumannomyces tritici R3-111a-1]